MTVTIEIPIDESQIDDATKEQLRRVALEAVILRLFAERRISPARAARVLGLTGIQFMDLVQQKGLPHTDCNAADLAEDLANLDAIDKQFSDARR